MRASSSNPDSSFGPATRWPYALFVLSGFAALVLEAVFLRQLAWLVGNSAVATSLVLAAFMGGLALGAALFGRLADRTPRPLRLFGLLELGTALASLALVTLLGTGRELFLAPLRLLESGAAQRGVESILAFTLLLLPTVLMGGTLPALSRALIREMGRFVGSLGWLYALNTLGAAAGVFVAGFYLFELLGISRSAWVALALQVGVGLAALLLDRRRGPLGPVRARVPEARGEPSPADARQACLLAATVGGFAVLGYEVAWTRLLSLFMRSFSYSFSLMLGLFLFGLFLGALGLGFVGHRIAQPARLVGWLQVAMGLYVAASLFWLADYVAPVGASSFTEFLWRSTLKAVPVVLPPTLLSGMVLPLAARGFARGPGRVGGDVGLVYGLNTVGAILGALLTGLVLLPRLGAPTALALLALVNAASGAFLLARLPGRRTQAAVALALALLCALPLARGDERFVRAFLRATRSAEQIGELLFFHEGATDTVAIVRKQYGFHDPRAKSLITNGVAMSATVKPVWRYMAAEGHIPLLLAAGRDSALVIGVGTGITLSAVVSHPEVRSITAAELSEGVVRGLEHFRDENAGAHLDPRVTLLREDGRHFLELTPDRFDVITLEPPPPIVAGSVHLYSLDFYRLCLRRLNEGGTVAQWLPLHAQSLASARMTARTFLEAFPHATLWLPSVRDAVLIGSASPRRLDLDRLFESYRSAPTRDNLVEAYLETPEALLGTLLLDRPGIAAWAGDAALITDEHPRMEFFRHQGANMRDADIATLLALPQAAWDGVAAWDERPGLLARVEHENRALRLYARGISNGDVPAGQQAARMAAGTEFTLYPHGCTTRQLDDLTRSGGNVPEPARAAQLARCAALRSKPWP